MMTMDKTLMKDLPWRAMAGLLAAIVLCAVAAGGFWYLKWSADDKVRVLEDELAAQKMLEPYVANVRRRQADMRAMTVGSTVHPKPESVTGMLGVLKTIADASGIPNMQFVPDATSVVGRSDIRLVGRGDGATEAFRRFVLALSDQPWVVRIEEVKAFAGDETHDFELALRATYGKAGGGK